MSQTPVLPDSVTITVTPTVTSPLSPSQVWTPIDDLTGAGPEVPTVDPTLPPGTMVGRATPDYIDYLFLSFNTSTAFSPTDTMPLTSRMKLLMMLEASISLLTLALVAARAVNILA